MTIQREETELEIEAPSNDSTVYVEVFHFHVRCFAAWQFELLKGGLSQVSPVC